MSKNDSSPPWKNSGKGKGRKGGLAVRRLEDNLGWVLVHPRAARDRRDDLDEVRNMIAGGEVEIATDELRWLLSECSEFVAAHVLLGELAVERGEDVELARGHFGFAFQLGEKALEKAACTGPLPGSEPENRPWYDAARGLAWCLEKQSQGAVADRIVAIVRGFDPTDPAGIVPMLERLRSDQMPILEIQ